MHKFQVGDMVQFELSKSQKNPRWDCGKDQGASGKIGYGEVIDILSDDRFVIKYGTGSEWEFDFMDSEQPGFPSKANGFKAGDRVIFEWAASGTVPRINLGNDQKASGVYGKGKVTMAAIDGETGMFNIEYYINNQRANYNFRYQDSNMPGFPKLDKPNDEQLKAKDALKRWLGDDRS